MAIITVTTLNDDIANDGFVSLREAIQAANSDSGVNEAPPGSGADTIVFQSSLSGTIVLTGALQLTSDITIVGDSTPDIVLDGDGASQIFTNTSGAVTIELRNLVLTNGAAAGDGGAILTGASAALTIVNSTISNSSATGNGGAVFSGGSLTIVNSTLSGNVATGSGGAVFAGGYGGFSNVTVSGNQAAAGGGIATSSGSLAVHTSTITQNHATSAGAGGGIDLQNASGLMLNSVLAGNTSGPGLDPDDLHEISGGYFTAGFSFLGSSVVVDVALYGGSILYGDDPGLGALANNGGPRQTHAIAAGSPLIGTGRAGSIDPDDHDIDGDANTGEALPVDAAGHARVQGNLDIGAFESDFGLTVTASDDLDDVLSTLAADLNDGDGLTLREAIAHAAAGEKIGFALSLAGDAILLDQTAGTLFLSSDISIDGDVDGDGFADIAIFGGNDTQIFHVQNSASVTLRSLYVAHGYGQFGGGAIETELGSTLAVVNSIVASNDGYLGGAILLGGSGTIVNSIVAANSAMRGGAVYVASGQSLTLINATIALNYSLDNGGGIATSTNASLTAIQSTITQNYAGQNGGGVYLHTGSTLRADNSIVSGNSSFNGTDISSSGNDTHLIARNSLLGLGIEIPPLNISTTQVISADDPGLTFGGYAFVPVAGSPLIDAGDDTLVPDDDFDIDGDGDTSELLPLDARGGPRVAGAHVDIGAAEKLAFGDTNGSDAVTEDTDLTASDAVDGVLANDPVLTTVVNYIAGPYTGGFLGSFPSEVDGDYGTLTMATDGTWSYVLDNSKAAVNALATGETLTDVFTYFAIDSFFGGIFDLSELAITINGHNDAPTAVADDLVATEDTAITFTAAQLLGNDTDPDNGTVLTIASVTSGTGGTVVKNLDGTVTFTPSANFNGAASFTYVASDGTAQSGSATATIIVAPVNDAPVITSNGGGASAGIAVAENDTAVTTVTSADPDVNAARAFAIFGGADQGRFTIDATTGVLAFVVAPDFETPGDVGGDNIYDVIVAVSDGSLPVTTQALAVTVTNVVGHTIIRNGRPNTIDGTRPVGNATTGEEDTIRGRAGNDTIRAGGGNDTVKGGTGDDVLGGQAGHDLLRGGAGMDLLNGGNGVDTADYSDMTASVVLTLTGRNEAIATVGGLVDDTVKNVENIIGGEAGDTLTGDARANILRGGLGNDSLDGARGDDSLRGNRGEDTINGGLGRDTLTGGADNDTFMFSARLGAGNVDAITDFSHGADLIRLDATVFAAIGPTLDAGEFYAHAGAIKAHDADHRIVYNRTTGDLYYDADGKGGDAAILSATLTTRPPLFDAGDIGVA